MNESPNNSYALKKLESKFTWRHLLLDTKEFRKVKKLENRLNLQDAGSQKNHIAMFHGPPGTGKTLTASLLGKYTKKDLYRIDLSVVISKYIGETEKNIDAIFEHTSNQDSILFFDEADALFGKRTEVSDAHDRYANQEVSYLLQRIENHPGLVILSITALGNIENTLKRNFDTIIEFKHLSFTQRYIYKVKNYFRT